MFRIHVRHATSRLHIHFRLEMCSTIVSEEAYYIYGEKQLVKGHESKQSIDCGPSLFRVSCVSKKV